MVDEGVHILAGYRHLQCVDFGINPEHPPMAKMLAAVPLRFRAMQEPPWDCGSKMTSKPDSFTFGNRFIIENGVDEVMTETRLSIALLSLFLAVAVFLAAREMFGRAEALVALAILAFEPSLIAHGSQITTDMALSATVFAAVFALYRFRKKETWSRFVVAGLAVGLLLAAKHSALVFIPILFVLLITDALFFKRDEKMSWLHRIFRQTAVFAAIFLIGLVILWAFYGFRYYSIPDATERTISIAEYIKENGRPEMVESLSAKMVEAVNRTRIFPESYVLGMADVVAWGSRNSFLFGKSYPTGKWFYFPIAFLVKSSVALLLLLPVGFAAAYFMREKRREMLFLLVPPLVFFGVAMNSNMTIGIRHILPIYGFLIVVAAAGAASLVRKYNVFKFFLILLFGYHVLSAARVAPNYVTFANDFWGGTENAHRIFIDSNVDLGQNVKLVNEYLKREGVTDCWFAAFVHPEIIKHTQPCRVLPSGLRVLVSQTVIEPVPPVIEGTVLISVNELPPRAGDEYAPVTQSQPVAFIGGNIFVYRGRFEVPLAAAMSRVYRSGQFLRLNQIEEALAESRQAVELGGNDPRPHLAFGLALLRAGQQDEARREFETTMELTKTNPTLRNAQVRAQQELEKLK